MQFRESERPRDEGDLSGDDEHWSRSMATLAGFFGSLPFGVGLWAPILLFFELQRGGWPDFPTLPDTLYRALGVLMVCAPALAPFAIAMSRVGRGGWSRVLAVVVTGLTVGAGLALLWCLGFLLLMAAGVLGLILGLITVIPCRSRGDAAGRALALLGLSPALLALIAGLVQAWPEEIPQAAGGVLLGLAAVGLVIICRRGSRGPSGFKPRPRDWDDFDRPGGWKY